jgi:hypothetical protein
VVIVFTDGGRCVDLVATFGKSYRTAWEDGAGVGGSGCEPWRRVLPGKNGEVYVHGGRRLGAFLAAGHPKLKSRLRALGEVWQEGDEEMTALFDVEAYRPVFKLLGIRRKRQATEAQLARLAAGRARTPAREGLRAAGGANS